jgi:hypothetical protein
LNNYAFAAAIGLFLGIAMVWWVRPDTNAGTAFIVVASTIFCFVAGAVLTFVGKLFRTTRSPPLGATMTLPRFYRRCRWRHAAREINDLACRVGAS